MIFTTNKPLPAWGKELHDEDLAATFWIASWSVDASSTSTDPPGGRVI
jgi:hypothetical protein